MTFDTLIVNGRVVIATDTYASDIAINSGKIVAIGDQLTPSNKIDEPERKVSAGRRKSEAPIIGPGRGILREPQGTPLLLVNTRRFSDTYAGYALLLPAKPVSQAQSGRVHT